MDMNYAQEQAEQVEVFNLENEKTTVEYEANQLKACAVTRTKGTAVRVDLQGAGSAFRLHRPDGRGTSLPPTSSSRLLTATKRRSLLPIRNRPARSRTTTRPSPNCPSTAWSRSARRSST